ncbi:MAG: amino acid permease [Clostridiales Family XIII bacterium]|jgi:AAT family amino acid transporter|nr:amino acid permease [Clostridiales Family XIII bacterium]
MSDNPRIVEKSERMLTRGIQPWHVSLIALGGIIGSCYFLELGDTYASLGPGAVLITYAVAGLTIFGVMQSFAELLVNIPRRGSFISYTREFLGDTASAGIGWAFWANWVCYIPSEALAAAIFMNSLISEIGGVELGSAWTFLWGIVALALLTLINVYHVKWFGHVESIMAIIKIVAIVLFVICGICIWLGLMASDVREWGGDTGFIGTSIMLAGEGSITSKLFPEGGFVMITLMIWTLVNFQGSEIVGLSAAETQNPEVNVPLACKRVAYRIILIYLVPIFVLTLIMPYFEGNIEKSVFADALYHYGFTWGSQLFTVVTLIAAFSCANSGFYGTVRSLYGLSVEGMAPKFLSDLNRFNTPQNATLFTLVPIWLVFILGFGIDELGWWGGEMPLYTALVGIAGFTGTLCWVGILLSQIKFRKRLVQRGYDPQTVLKAKAAWYPWLEYFAIILQVAAMVLLIFEDGGLDIFVLSMIIIIVPIIIYTVQKRRGRIRTSITIGMDEVTFDEKFPDKSGR